LEKSGKLKYAQNNFKTCVDYLIGYIDAKLMNKVNVTTVIGNISPFSAGYFSKKLLNYDAKEIS